MGARISALAIGAFNGGDQGGALPPWNGVDRSGWRGLWWEQGGGADAGTGDSDGKRFGPDS